MSLSGIGTWVMCILVFVILGMYCQNNENEKNDEASESTH